MAITWEITAFGGKACLHIPISIKGERPFKAVDIMRNGELYKRYKPDSIEFEAEFTVKEKYKSNWYVRATQLDNHIAYSSPIWFE